MRDRDRKVLEISPTTLWSQRRSQAGRMEKMEKAVLAAFLSLGLVLGNVCGADAAPAGPGADRPAPVELFVAEEREVALDREYIGQVEPIQSVELHPQVSAVIESVEFREGGSVKKGEALFTLDGRTYSAAAELRRAELDQARADDDRARRFLKRMEAADKRSVTASALDEARCAALDAGARVRRARAALKMAELDLQHTRVRSPIDGRIGAALATRGSYVTPTTPLARVVQVDPIRVSFAVSDREYLAERSLFTDGRGALSVRAVLPGGVELPASGHPDFVDNRMNPGTGAILVKYRFDNPDGTLVPGGLVMLRVRLLLGRLLLVPQESVVAGRDGDFVWLVGDGETVSPRPVVTGRTTGGMVEVVKGLASGDHIVHRGLQRVRPGGVVTATEPSKGR